MKGWARLLVVLAAASGVSAAVLSPAAADSSADCFSEETERRIRGCSELIDTPGISATQRSMAHAMRALAYSIKGQYEMALPDYDIAIGLAPDFDVALNNRAWALYKAGRAAEGLDDVEKALGLAPTSPHAYDTRAHIVQAMGLAHIAIRDYERAMRFGGERMIKLYQCGLQSQGKYEGPIDGKYSSIMKQALEACAAERTCDPLPPDEDCQKLIS